VQEVNVASTSTIINHYSEIKSTDKSFEYFDLHKMYKSERSSNSNFSYRNDSLKDNIVRLDV
jgi:hypothetical protein